MTGDERWNEIKDLLGEALERPKAERRAFLDAACGEDAELRRVLEIYLEEEERAGGFLEEPIFAVHRHEVPGAGERLGAYRLGRRLGRGGMGTVYLAERVDGVVDQRAAVKVLKRGLDTDEIVGRFSAERRILARLEHPNVARFVDAGATADGRPYFVMEYVDGEPLDAWCDARKLDVRARVKLFCQVLDAVGFAHRNLVVHRDLKPENILVTAEGTVKLLDFGIAKLLYDGGQTRSTVTSLGPAPMTPAYASPEQVRGETVTTASDVYSLGIVLYELLTGRPPYRVESLQSDEVARIVCETQPLRPSAAVRRDDASSGEARRLARRLRGDLDNIVLKALDKEPERRFSSVEQLAEDLRRYLEGLPVRSRPANLTYKVGKFVRRNAATVSLGLTVFVLVVAFGVTMALLNARIAREVARANSMTQFLVDTLRYLGMSEEPLHVRERITAAVEQLRTELKDEPASRAVLLDTVGRTCWNLGLYTEARPLLEEALELRRATLSDDDPLVAESLHNLANVDLDLGDMPVAEQRMRRALGIQRRAFPEGHVDLARGLHNLAFLLWETKRLGEAEKVAWEALEMKRQRLGPEHFEVAVTSNVLATILRRREKLRESEQLYRLAIDIYRRNDRATGPHMARALSNLGAIVSDLDRHEEAEGLYSEALEIRRDLHGSCLRDMVGILNNRGKNQIYLDPTLARSLLEEALAFERRSSPEPARESSATATVKRNLAMAYGRLGETRECERLAGEALAYFREYDGSDEAVTEAESVLNSCRGPS